MDKLVKEVINQLNAAWRFRWYGVAIAWVICVGGWLAVSLQADKYEATARVYVDTTSDLQAILGNQIVESDVSDQLSFVREAILGQEELEQVALEMGLTDGIETEQDMARFLAGLRQSISVFRQPLEGETPFNRSSAATYVIQYMHPSAETARLVVERMLDTFMRNSLGDKTSNSETARSFLQEQIAVYEQRLAGAEDKLARFNRENYDRLPSLQGGYFQSLQEEAQALSAARQSLRVAQSQLNQINQQLRGEIPRISATGEIDPNSLESRLARAESELSDLELRFTDKHPQVIGMRQLVSRLQDEQDQQQAEIVAGLRVANSNNPVYQAVLIARNEAEQQIAMIQADISDREAQVTNLRSYIDEMPQVEAELAQLNRDYTVIKEHYQSLLNSLEREKLTREAFQTEQIDFRVIDPPSTGGAPVAPRRAVLLLLVLAAGLGAGAGAVYLSGQLFPRFTSTSSLESRFSLPSLGSVSVIRSEQFLRTQKLSRLNVLLAVVFLIVTFAGVFVFEIHGPGLRGYL